METQNELESMSDRELEFELGLLAFHPKESGEHVIPRYCSSPNDIMPLVVEHKMRLIPYCGDKYLAGKYSDKPKVFLDSKHERPFRAATIVLILLLQGEE